MVQELATQWLQSYPCKTKSCQETDKSLRKFVVPSADPKVMYTVKSLEFGKVCQDLLWNHCTSPSHRSETNGIAERGGGGGGSVKTTIVSPSSLRAGFDASAATAVGVSLVAYRLLGGDFRKNVSAVSAMPGSTVDTGSCVRIGKLLEQFSPPFFI